MGTNFNADNYNSRGLFASAQFPRKLRDMTDGLSNTVAMSERAWGGGNFAPRAAVAGDPFKGVTVVEPNVMVNPASCLATVSGQQILVGRQYKSRFGSTWSDGQMERVGFNTVLAPNAVSCVNDANASADSTGGALNASSYHPGGVNVVLADGSVTFMTESIDTGNTTLPPVAGGISPYGIWGAMGSMGEGEAITQ